MKDIDTLLSQHSPKPKKQLPSNFTQTIVAELKENPQPQRSRLRNLLGNLRRHSVTTSLAGMVILGGTASAITLWPTPSVTPTITKLLPSGNHIVGVDAENCQYFKGVDGSTPQPTSEKLYYEVREGSKLTDTQIVAAVQGICEEKVSDNAITTIIKQLPQNTPGMESTSAYVINGITGNSITVSMDPHYDASLYTTLPNMTYIHFAKNLITYDRNTKVTFSDFKAGDTVKMIVQDTSGKSSETEEHYNPLNHPDSITILAMVKIPALTADPTTFYTAVAKDIVRAEPCTTSPTGFCRAYDFAK